MPEKGRFISRLRDFFSPEKVVVGSRPPRGLLSPEERERKQEALQVLLDRSQAAGFDPDSPLRRADRGENPEITRIS